MNIDLLITARWVIPVEPADTVYNDYAIAVNERQIIDLLPASEAATRYSAAETVSLDRHAVIPGLVNSHTHSAMALLRGYADDLPLMTWLNDYIWPAEQTWASPGFVEDGSRLAIAEMLRSGTTCFADMYFFPDSTAEVAIETGIRAVIGLIMIDFPTPWARDPQEYFEKGEHVHDKYKHSPLIRTAFAPHSPYAVSAEPLERIGTLAEELDIPIQIHVHETADEVKQSVEQYGKRPLQRLHDIGLLSNRLLAVHMTQLLPEEIDLLARYNVNIAHCPESNLKLASGFCPVNELLKADINVTLGTDGCASNNDLDMIAEMRTAALLGKGVANDSRVLSASQVLRMATINPARALGMESITGSLLPGKDADLCAIDLGQLETQPLYDPVSQVIYASSRNQVTDVWVAGKQLLKNRELLTINEESVRHHAAAWQQKLNTGRVAKTGGG